MWGRCTLLCAATAAGVWCATCRRRLLRPLDFISLANSIVMSVMLIKMFGSGMAWYDMYPAVLFAGMAVIQLGVMMFKPELHQRFRFQVGV